MPDLKPCPFCKSNDIHVSDAVGVICRKCRAHAQSVEAWNRRAMLPSVRALVEWADEQERGYIAVGCDPSVGTRLVDDVRKHYGEASE